MTSIEIGGVAARPAPARAPASSSPGASSRATAGGRRIRSRSPPRPTAAGCGSRSRAVGDYTAALRALPPGTRVIAEGPFGAFTAAARRRAARGADRRRGRHHADPRAARGDARRAGRHHRRLPRARGRRRDPARGARRARAPRAAPRCTTCSATTATALLSPEHLQQLVPDIAERDVYVCGPPAMTAATRASLDRLGRAAPPHRHRAVRVLMRRAVAALVVTVVAVVLLAGYDTKPPRTVNPNSPRRARAADARRRRRRRPGARTATGPAVVTTPFSVIQVQATRHRGRLTGVETLALTGDGPHTDALNAPRRADPAREALKAGSAKIDVVSGATYTSESWSESLQARSTGARVAERVEHVMGMPVRDHVRDAAVDLDPAFAWLRWVDATFSPYRADSEVAAWPRRAARARRRIRRCARCSRAARRCGRETGGYFDAYASRPARPLAASSRAGRSTGRRRCSTAGARVLHRRRRRRARARRAVARRDPPPAPSATGWPRVLVLRRRGRHLGRLRARRAHRRPAHAAARPTASLSVTVIGPRSRPPTPTPPPPSRWAGGGRRGPPACAATRR